MADMRVCMGMYGLAHHVPERSKCVVAAAALEEARYVLLQVIMHFDTFCKYSTVSTSMC